LGDAEVSLEIGGSWMMGWVVGCLTSIHFVKRVRRGQSYIDISHIRLGRSAKYDSGQILHGEGTVPTRQMRLGS
jgi:hypothetical protein